ncbi:MinD/ParA family protein [Algisphaera agarilytica]|uniref:Flagellar biosynthesis protein FlhG n=1 Tax=Algisphaera agarilytica TaxID=1385975 RepID=A0A7X0LM83_9BACT|nr:MinD/ParA family protein [Algisphaera agarilytica]MBB6430758.1 flagellar biosynthesis protein FlhG [Algisphaera agarilytica]
MSVADQAAALRGLVEQYEQSNGPRGAGMTRAQPRLAQTLAITSGKGGVGKTTVTVNLAVQLARLGRRVVLLDADLGTANADVMCNVNARSTLAHVVAGQRELEDIIVDAPGGFRLVPGASGLANMANLSAHEHDRLNAQMRRLESSCDVLLIDTGAGVGPNVLSFCVAAERLLVVTTPEPTSITDAYAVIKTINAQTSHPDIRLLVNMVENEAEARAVFARINGVCQRFLGLSPNYAGHVVTDAKVSRAVRQRRPFVLDTPNTKASVCVLSLAHRLDRHAMDPRRQSAGLIKKMASWLRH